MKGSGAFLPNQDEGYINYVLYCIVVPEAEA
jgi:hypothetical protein